MRWLLPFCVGFCAGAVCVLRAEKRLEMDTVRWLAGFQ